METPGGYEVENNNASLFGNADEALPVHDTDTNLAVFSPARAKDKNESIWPAVIDSILAAPLRVEATKAEVLVYSE
jgi:hypothetical protein